MTCEYCGKYIPNQLTECPYCGAANPVFKQMEDELANLKEEKKRLKDKLESMAPNGKEDLTSEQIKASSDFATRVIICSIIAAIATTIAFSINHNIDFISTFCLFFFLDAIGNIFLFLFLDVVFKVNKIVQFIICAGFIILGCIILK